MDLTDQKLSGTGEIYLNDSLNAYLMKLKVKMTTNSIAPIDNDVIIYVDKNSSSNPTEERKQYILNLSAPLQKFSEAGDELIEQIKIENSKVSFEAYVERFVNESGNGVLAEQTKEVIDSIPITLFEGENYIYTNYQNVDIEIVYPKNNDINKMFLNNGIFAEYSKYGSNGLTLDDIYFKDAFTKTANNLNLEVDHATINCLSSKNNAFSLDSEGNLIVNSITSNENNNSPTIDMDTIRDFIYPVGSLYISVASTSPENLFGGSWESISGYYLYAGTGGTTSGSNKSSVPSTNTTGSTAITVAQMPSHTHTQNSHRHAQHKDCWMNDASHCDTRISQSSGFYAGAGNATYYTDSTTATNQNTGGGQGHTHTLSSHTHTISPLRYEVYMWKRTA